MSRSLWQTIAKQKFHSNGSTCLRQFTCQIARLFCPQDYGDSIDNIHYSRDKKQSRQNKDWLSRYSKRDSRHDFVNDNSWNSDDDIENRFNLYSENQFSRNSKSENKHMYNRYAKGKDKYNWNLAYKNQSKLQGNSASAWDLLHGEDSSRSNASLNYGLTGRGKLSARTYERFQKNDLIAKGEVLFGFHPVYMALKYGKRECKRLIIRSIEKEIMNQVHDLATQRGVEVSVIDNKGKLLYLSEGRPNQGICMHVGPIKPEMFDAETEISAALNMESRTSYPLYVLAHSVKDPMNFGSIVRTSFFLGIEKIIMLKKNSCGLTPVVSKASSGALEVLPMAYCRNVKNQLEVWKEKGGCVVGTSSDLSLNRPATHVETFKISKPTIVIVGNEEVGVDDSILNMCDEVLTISPRRKDLEDVNSLNVGVATGILLHTLQNNNTIS